MKNYEFWGQIPKISLKIHYFFRKSSNKKTKTPRRAAEEIWQFQLINLFTQKLTIISPKIYPKNGFEEDNSFETVVSFNQAKHCLLKLGKVAYRTLKILVQCSSVLSWTIHYLSIHWLEILLKNFNRQQITTSFRNSKLFSRYFNTTLNFFHTFLFLPNIHQIHHIQW